MFLRPFWISPRQCIVVPVSPETIDYVFEVCKKIKKARFMCDVDVDNSRTLNYKIRRAQVDQYNYILVVGAKEVENNTVNVRSRDNARHGEHSIDNVIVKFSKLSQEKAAMDHFTQKEEAPGLL